jgi:hypothetical protein
MVTSRKARRPKPPRSRTDRISSNRFAFCTYSFINANQKGFNKPNIECGWAARPASEPQVPFRSRLSQRAWALSYRCHQGDSIAQVGRRRGRRLLGSRRDVSCRLDHSFRTDLGIAPRIPCIGADHEIPRPREAPLLGRLRQQASLFDRQRDSSVFELPLDHHGADVEFVA